MTIYFWSWLLLVVARPSPRPPRSFSPNSPLFWKQRPSADPEGVWTLQNWLFHLGHHIHQSDHRGRHLRYNLLASPRPVTQYHFLLFLQVYSQYIFLLFLCADFTQYNIWLKTCICPSVEAHQHKKPENLSVLHFCFF